MSPERCEAMGVELVVGGATPEELTAVRSLFELWEQTFSLVGTDSELVRVNSAPTRLVALSPLFARVLATALEAVDSTGGLVDPTLGTTQRLRLKSRLLGRPPGTKLDLNGVVKSLAVDEALARISGPGFVSAGGDVAARGTAIVGLPGGDTLQLRNGGLATSGTTRWHDHLIDPRTGRPSSSCWTEVTVAAPSCLAADVAAKAAFLLSREGPGWLDRRGLPGRFRAGARIVTNRVWRDAMEVRAAA
jgi:thiamine biosynthesis lipoprotein